MNPINQMPVVLQGDTFTPNGKVDTDHSDTFTCANCGLSKPMTKGITTGYGINSDGNKVCFACCADIDRAALQQYGNSDKAGVWLYLTGNYSDGYKVTNWPGSLEYKVYYRSTGYHNIARTRQDVYFSDETGARWWGVQYGEWTQIVHCKRLKS